MNIAANVLAAFQIEHKEHLEGIRSIITTADNQSPRAGDPSLDEAFRLAHSLKGGARVCNLRDVEVLGHHLESIFARMRQGAMALDEQIRVLINQVLDTIEDVMVAVGAHRSGKVPPEQTTQLVDQLTRLLEGRPATATIASPVPSVPVTQQVHPATQPPAPIETSVASVTLAAPVAPTQTVEAAEQIPDDPSADDEAVSAATPALQAQTLRVSAENLDELLRTADELQTQSLGQEQLRRLLHRLDERLQIVHELYEQSQRNDRSSRRSDQLNHQWRELTQLSRQVRLIQRRSSWSLRRLAGELERNARQARTVQAQNVLQGLRKMVRDLARDTKKQVDFQATGLDVQADRLVLQAIKDPLMHILRNSVVHGIELPHERTAAGKSPTGRITLRIEARGHQLNIMVEDDGKGLDLGRIGERAVQAGLMTPQERAAQSVTELSRLIFQPGLTTVTDVNEMAGRGMGLSVVAQAAARLQGQVSVDKGSGGMGLRIALCVPQGMAAHRLLLVQCRDQTLAFPTHGIDQLLELTSPETETIEGMPVIRLEGKPVPLVNLANQLGLGDRGTDEQDKAVVVLESGPRRVAVAVDALLTERSALIKPLSGPAAMLSHFAGAVLMEDAPPALVLNPQELIEASLSPRRASVRADRSPVPEQKPAAPTILVVDDSFTTRTLEKSLLEAHGYDVRIAVDGAEALNYLRSQSIDLVISDVEMPRMDGFTLLEQIKKDPHLTSVPVIMVTSRDHREDQERGLSLGAEAYIIKKRFDHQELLQTIRQCLG